MESSEANIISDGLKYLLQWGHDLAVMERAETAAIEEAYEWLQWGHDLAVMERYWND